MPEGVQKIDAVLVALENGFLFIAPGRDAADCTGVLYAKWACHTGQTVARNQANVNSKDPTLSDRRQRQRSGNTGSSTRSTPGSQKLCYNEDRNRPLFFRDRKRLSGRLRPVPVYRLKGARMNRIEKKETAADAAKLFKEEVIELIPDISRKELCDMVDDFIYYQTDAMSKEEARALVDVNCRLGPQ